MKEQPAQMKTVALYVLLLIICLSAFTSIANTRKVEKLKYSDFIRMLQDKNPVKKIISIRINDREITGQMVGQSIIANERETVYFQTIAPEDPGLMDIIRTSKISVETEPPAQMSWWLNLLINWFPFILLIGAWIYILQKMQGGGAKALSFGKSRAFIDNRNAAG